MPITSAGAAAKADNACFEQSLASKPFLFVIGEEGKEFHVHKELIGQLSPALNALVNGQMKEAREGRVEWPDLDTDTFVRFAKYAYSGDYTEAEPEILTPLITVLEDHSATEQQGSQGSERETTDLAIHQDHESSSSSSISGDDEEGSTSMSEDDDDEGDDDEEDDDEEDEAEHGHRDPTANRIESAESSSVVSSTLGEAQTNHAPLKLPYSIKYYMWRWQYRLDALLTQRTQQDLRNHEARPQKRRRLLDTTEDRLDPRFHDKYQAMKHFGQLNVPSLVAPTAADACWRPRPNVDTWESYRSVFLSHAKLYVLADKYGVEDLRALTLRRLHETLMEFTIFPERIPDLVAIVHTIYDNTVEDDVARNMIVAFFSCIGEDVKTCEEFRTALRCQGDFADDLFQKITNRLYREVM
ncbi:hypothetical protein BKA56DRAFT_156314 [Ilyonectria sp. MPI-CAGE-AT-0026]|nr:hypothetical protein BKA56DRAFT_156314 [Ilyonectria sp. MPI-CAGE-AT-0026]